MKLAIISDLHIGRKMYRTDENSYNKYEKAGYDALQQNIDIIKEQKPDLIINAGDVFDVADPSAVAITKFLQGQAQLNAIAKNAIILGNHDFSFNNKRNHCSVIEMSNPTYYADYDIKSFVEEDILFIMMPYIYDKADNIKQYLKKCQDMAKNATNKKKILITHGVTDHYFKESLISDPILLSDELVAEFDLVIIGHIHTPYNYKQGKTLVISPGSLIDYQAYTDRTGPIFLDTDTMEFKKIPVKTPHIIKLKCTEKDINEKLKNVTFDIYHISYDGDVNAIDNDLFIEAKNKCVNLVIDVLRHEEEEQKKVKLSTLNIYDWVKEHYPNYAEVFNNAKEVLIE